jgi:hypothetical protein
VLADPRKVGDPKLEKKLPGKAIRLCLNVHYYDITNSMAYGTRRFNAAFTTVIQ